MKLSVSRGLAAGLVLAALGASGQGPSPPTETKRTLPALASGITAMPGEPAESPVELRQQRMQTLDGHMQSITRSLLDESRPGAAADALLNHIQAVEALSRDLPALFPPGSASAPASRAKLEVWTRSEQFKAAVSEFRTAVEKFSAVAQSGDIGRIRSAYRDLNLDQACNGCHLAFRKESGIAPAPGPAGAAGSDGRRP